MTLKLKIIIIIQNLKFVTTYEYQNTQIFFQKITFQIVLNKFLLLKKLKNTVLWVYVTEDLKGEEVVRAFYENDVEKAAGVNTSDFAEKADLACLESKTDEIDVNKLKTVPTKFS